MEIKPFSNELEGWLKNNSHKTVGDLADFFGEKSFAVVFMLFMFIPSLPIPTGGITTFVLLPVTMVVALEMIFGLREIWIPKKARKIQLSSGLLNKGLPFMFKNIRRLEKYSRQRGALIFNTRIFRILSGLVIFILALASFIAPPFSGLDTVPSMGAVVVALSLIIEDIYLFMVGVLLGIIGIGIIVAAASAITEFFRFFVN
ncbi:MAG: exopolysaccharide biosynthesis protein [Acidimicrobiaceae bacterium]|nr:exopolysaccharide biosynthesis protein [Acidimicrobiaceae bacterium]